RVGYRRRIDSRTGVEAPDFLQRPGVIGRERAVGAADEDQVAGRREHAAEVRIFKLGPVFGFAGDRIDGPQASVQLLDQLVAATRETVARLERATLIGEVLLLFRKDLIAALLGGDEEQTEFW